MIRDYHAVCVRHRRDKLTPQVASCWVAVEHYEGLTFAFVYIVHFESADFQVIGSERV